MFSMYAMFCLSRLGSVTKEFQPVYMGTLQKKVHIIHRIYLCFVVRRLVGKGAVLISYVKTVILGFLRHGSRTQKHVLIFFVRGHT